MLTPDADQVGDVEAVLDVGDQLVRCQACRLRGADCWALGEGTDETPRCACPVVARPSSRAVAQSSSHERSTPSSTSASFLPATPSPSNGCERSPRSRKRIVDDANAVGEQLRAHLVSQEAGLARDRRAVDGAGEMRHQRAGDARIEHHRHLARRHLARVEPRDRALAGGAADLLRRFQIAGVPHGAE